MRTHDQSVTEQFDPQAQAYLASSVHAGGPDLAWVSDWLAQQNYAGAEALDVGCGAGHLGFLLGTRTARLTLADPSPSMLATAQAEAVRRGMTRVLGEVAKAEQLPFADHRFDLVASRFSAHHWRDVPAALKQMRRVVKPGGRLLLIDTLGADSPLVDTHLQTIEILRDPSHVRNHTAAQWRAMIADAGFEVSHDARWALRLEFASWAARMRTPSAALAAIEWVWSRAPVEVHRELSVEPDRSFTIQVGLFVADAA
jgi:ubiquinone/menaquinone biosynthesis C-methylase UbiE